MFANSLDEMYPNMYDGRRPGEYSPRRPGENSSPRAGGRSPVVSRPDTTGTLKTTISLRSTPAIVHSSHSGPFYLLKDNIKTEPVLTGATNMMLHYNLEHTFNKFIGRKVKDKLSAFLPSLPGNIDIPVSADGTGDSSLRKVIQQPPVGGKELNILSGAQLAGFRLHPGPLPDQYRTANFQALKKKKHKKHKADIPGNETPTLGGGVGGPAMITLATGPEGPFGSEAEKKHKKPKKHDEERKKRKKDKKKKKRHSPEPGAPTTPLAPSATSMQLQ